MSSLRLAYVTNGLQGHRLEDALRLLAEEGYQGVGLTLDHRHLDPFPPGLAARLARLGALLQELDLAVAIETGAGFLLDPRRRHQPTLLSEGRERRIDLLVRAVMIAAELGAEAVSFWSGVAPPGLSPRELRERLLRGCEAVLEAAEARQVRLGLEPEPGMLVERLADAERVRAALGAPPLLGVTLDIGHCHCVEDRPPAECVRRALPWLANVHIEDMRRGVHEHLDFGEGEVAFAPVLGALAEGGYAGLVCVELPRHGHLAHLTVPRSIALLRRSQPAGRPR